MLNKVIIASSNILKAAPLTGRVFLPRIEKDFYVWTPDGGFLQWKTKQRYYRRLQRKTRRLLRASSPGYSQQKPDPECQSETKAEQTGSVSSVTSCPEFIVTSRFTVKIITDMSFQAGNKCERIQKQQKLLLPLLSSAPFGIPGEDGRIHKEINKCMTDYSFCEIKQNNK